MSLTPSLIAAAAALGSIAEDLRGAIVAKGYPKATAEIRISGPRIEIALRTAGLVDAYAPRAFKPSYGYILTDYSLCGGETLAEAYAKAITSIEQMTPRPRDEDYAPWFDAAAMVRPAAQAAE